MAMSQALVDDAFADLAREQAATDAVLAEPLDLGERVGGRHRRQGAVVIDLSPVVAAMRRVCDSSAITRRCTRVAPQDFHYDGRRKNPGLRDLVESDGGIVSGEEFERSCGTSGRSEDVLDLEALAAGGGTPHPPPGRPRAQRRRRSLPCIAGLLSRSVGRPRAVT